MSSLRRGRLHQEGFISALVLVPSWLAIIPQAQGTLVSLAVCSSVRRKYKSLPVKYMQLSFSGGLISMERKKKTLFGLLSIYLGRSKGFSI